MPSIHTEGYDRDVINKLFRTDEKLLFNKSVTFKINTYQYKMLIEFSEISGHSVSEICREVVNDFLLCAKDIDTIKS